MDKKKRSSIRNTFKDEQTPDVRTKRISFSARRSVREFCREETAGHYQNSYEVSDSSGAGTSKLNSIVDNSTGETFNQSSSAASAARRGIVQAIYEDDDKENITIENRIGDDHTVREDIDSMLIDNVTLLPDELKRLRLNRSKNMRSKTTTDESIVASFSMLSESDREELRRPKNKYEVFEKTVDFMRDLPTKDEILKNDAAIKEAVSNFEQKLKPITFAIEADSFSNDFDAGFEIESTTKQAQNKTVENYSFMDIEIPINVRIEEDNKRKPAKSLLQPKQGAIRSTTMNKNEDNHSSNNSLAHSSISSADSTFSSPLIPDGIVSVDCKKKKFNLRQLNEELEQGRIKIFPNVPKTPTTDRKAKRSRPWYGDDDHMDLTGDTERQINAIKPRATLNFSDDDIELSNYVKGDFKIPKTNTPQIDKKRTLRYSQADDLLLDNTNFLTQAKLGDETLLRSNENVELEDLSLCNNPIKKDSNKDTIFFDCALNFDDEKTILPDSNRDNEQLVHGCRKTLHFDNMDIDSSCLAESKKTNCKLANDNFSKSKNRETMNFTKNNTILIERTLNKTDSLEHDLRAAQTRYEDFQQLETPVRNPLFQSKRLKMLQITPGRSMIEFENLENEFDKDNATDENICNISTNQSFQLKNESIENNNVNKPKSQRQTICKPLDIMQDSLFEIFEKDQNSQQKHVTVYMNSIIDLDNNKQITVANGAKDRRQTTCQIEDIVPETEIRNEENEDLEIRTVDNNIELKPTKERRQTSYKVESMSIEDNKDNALSLNNKTNNLKPRRKSLHIVTDIEVDAENLSHNPESSFVMKDKAQFEAKDNVHKALEKATNERLKSHRLQDIEVDSSSSTKSICSTSHKEVHPDTDYFLKPSNESLNFLKKSRQTTNQNLEMMDMDSTKFIQTICQNSGKENDIGTETSIGNSKSNLSFLKGRRQTTHQEQAIEVDTSHKEGDMETEPPNILDNYESSKSFVNFLKGRRQTTHKEQDMEVDTTKFTKPIHQTTQGELEIEAKDSFVLENPDSSLTKNKKSSLSLLKSRRQTTYQEQAIEVDTSHKEGDIETEPPNILDNYESSKSNVNFLKGRRQTTHQELDMEVDTTKFTKPIHRTTHGELEIEPKDSFVLENPDSFLTKTKKSSLSLLKYRRQSTHQEQAIEVDTSHKEAIETEPSIILDNNESSKSNVHFLKGCRQTTHQEQGMEVNTTKFAEPNTQENSFVLENPDSFLPKTKKSSISFLKNRRQTTHQEQAIEVDTSHKEGGIETEPSIVLNNYGSSKSNVNFLKGRRQTTHQEQDMELDTTKFSKPIHRNTHGEREIEAEDSFVLENPDSFFSKTKKSSISFLKNRRQTTHQEQAIEVDTSHKEGGIETEPSIVLDHYESSKSSVNFLKGRRQTTHQEQDMEVNTTKFTKPFHRNTHGEREIEAEDSFVLENPDSFLPKTKKSSISILKNRRQTTHQEQAIEVDTSHKEGGIETEPSIVLDHYESSKSSVNFLKGRRQTTHQEQDMEVDTTKFTKPFHRTTHGEREIEAEVSFVFDNPNSFLKKTKKPSLNLSNEHRKTTHKLQDIELDNTKFVESLDNLSLQPDKTRLNKLHCQTNYYCDDIETYSPEKTLKSNGEFLSGTKRLPINLTPNLPLSKKRPTIIFNNSNNMNFEMEMDKQNICTPEKISNSREINYSNKSTLSVSMPKECQSSSAKKRQQTSRIPVPITGRSPYTSPVPPTLYVDGIHDVDQSVQVPRRKIFQHTDSLSYKWDALNDMGTSCGNMESHENRDNNILPIYEGNVITISDVSAHFTAQRNMGKSSIPNSIQKSNENLREIRESDEFTKEFKGIARLNTIYMNLTSDTTVFSAAFPVRNDGTDLVENTRLSLVETLINESSTTNLINEEEASILNESENLVPKQKAAESIIQYEQSNNGAHASKEMMTASSCSKQFRNCATSFNETTSTTESFVLPQLPAWPNSFPALEKLRRLREKPTIADVEEYFRRKELAEHSCTLDDSDVIFEDSSHLVEYKSDVPQIIAELKESNEEVEEKIRNMPKPSPIVIYTDRLEKLLQQTPNWISDYELESRNRFMFYHRKIAVMKIIIEFEYKDDLHIDIQNAIARFESTRMDKKYWKPFDYLVDFQLQLKLQAVIPSNSLNGSEANVFKLLQNIDRTCIEIIKTCNKLWNIVCMKMAELKREGNRTIVRKFIRSILQREDAYSYVKEEEFVIEVHNIATISFKDIVYPKLYCFDDHIQYAPKGLEFLSEFLENPKKYFRN